MIKNILLRSFQILSIILLAFLTVSTFMPLKEDAGFLFLNRFYDSPLNFALWILMAVLLVAAVLFKGIRSPRQKFLHLALAIIIVLFIIDKSTNERFYMTLKEGNTTDLSNYIDSDPEIYDVDIKLKRFEIDLHEDEQSPRSYRSYLKLNDKDVVLEVNKPLAIGRYRLYQSAFEKHYYFDLQIGSKHYELSFGDTIKNAQEKIIVLDDYNSRIRHFRLIVDEQTRWLPLNSPVMIDDDEWSITSIGEVYSSVIEVVEVRGLFWLLLAGILYLAFMAWDFWKPKKQQEETA